MKKLNLHIYNNTTYLEKLLIKVIHLKKCIDIKKCDGAFIIVQKKSLKL